MMGALDAHGVYQYDETDVAAGPTFSGLLNKLGASVSNVLAALIPAIGSQLQGQATAQADGVLGNDLAYTAAKVTLTAGTWQLSAGLRLLTTDVTDSVACAIRNDTAGTTVANSTGEHGIATTAAAALVRSRPVVLTVAGDTIVMPLARRNGGSTVRVKTDSATLAPAGWITAVRLK